MIDWFEDNLRNLKNPTSISLGVFVLIMAALLIIGPPNVSIVIVSIFGVLGVLCFSSSYNKKDEI